MKIPRFLLLCVALAARAEEPAPAFALHDGDRVVFYGDSITQDGGYARWVEAYARSRFPTWNLRFYNAGVGGDTTRGGGAGDVGVRLERDVIRLHPTVVTIMLGMNDGGYRKLEPATLTGFTDRLRAIVVRLQEALPGVRIFLIRTSPFDDVSRPPDFAPGYNSVLRQLAEAVSQVGRERQAPVVDFGAALAAGIAAVACTDRDLAPHLLPDRVHPSSAGQLVMGATLLRAWHGPGRVARVAIDARSGTVVAENATVSELALQDGQPAWTETDRGLPLPVNWEDADTDLAQKAGAQLETLDDEPLVISGLRPGRYEIRIDDRTAGPFTAAELEKGVNLARSNTPMRWQAYLVRWGAEGSHQMQHVERQLRWAAASGKPGLVAAADSLAEKDEADQGSRSATAIPVARHFSVVRLP